MSRLATRFHWWLLLAYELGGRRSPRHAYRSASRLELNLEILTDRGTVP